MDVNKPASRVMALDAARGIAILMMAYVHMVPSEGGGALAAKVTAALEGKAAVLFFILAGMTWDLMSADKPAVIYRRAALYFFIGLLMHITVWNTEVLLPLGICLALFQLVRGKPRIGYMLATIGIAATLFVPLMFNGDAAMDIFEQPDELLKPGGVMRAATFVLYTDSYPIVPWWSLVWFGSRLSRVDAIFARSAWFVAAGCGLAAIGASGVLLTGVVPTAVRPIIEVKWAPTTLPFLCQCGGAALIIIGLAGWMERLFTFLMPLGRMSLTHYIGHILCVCIPLYRIYPDWDWPVGVGLSAFGFWVVGALLLSHMWMRRFTRGPLESAVQWLVSR
ncbi:MAG: DUF418 domain-containing protein [Armatimonadota bacterium]